MLEDPTRAVIAIEAMGRFGRRLRAGAEGSRRRYSAPVTLPDATPTEAQAKRLLADAGIASAPERACTTPKQAVAAAREIGFPVVLKILSPDILHKSGDRRRAAGRRGRRPRCAPASRR